MTDPTSLDTQARLTDIRLRIYNRERITPAEMRAVISDIIRDRESASRIAAKARRDVKRASVATPIAIDMDELFNV